AAAIRHAREWVRQDPLAEEPYRALMRLLALTDDHAGALRVYHACATALKRELAVEPSATTRDVYERLGRMHSRVVPVAAVERHTQALPAFIGRRHEWDRLRAAWQRSGVGEPSFVLVTGEAGIGKSRVAAE